MDRIKLCETCVNKKFDLKQGIVCGLTDEKPTFEVTCADYKVTEKQLNLSATIKEKIRPNKDRAKIATILIWSVLVVEILSIISSFMQYNLLTQLIDGTMFPDAELEANDNRESILALIYLGVYIVSAVTFIQWFRRAYYNLNIRTNCELSEGWAAGAWFVPILSLFRPYQIMKEMWTKTSGLIAAKSLDSAAPKSFNLMGIWWALWIISNIGQNIINSAFGGEGLNDYLGMTTGDIVLSILGIPLAIVTIKMIEAYSRKEEELLALEQGTTGTEKVPVPGPIIS